MNGKKSHASGTCDVQSGPDRGEQRAIVCEWTGDHGLSQVIPCEWTADHGLWRLITVNGHVIIGYGSRSSVNGELTTEYGHCSLPPPMAFCQMPLPADSHGQPESDKVNGRGRIEAERSEKAWLISL